MAVHRSIHTRAIDGPSLGRLDHHFFLFIGYGLDISIEEAKPPITSTSSKVLLGPPVLPVYQLFGGRVPLLK